MTARIYVGTYAKYNNGSIGGAWLDIEDYADKEDFLKACAELHKDETAPELMFQDYEGFPSAFYAESSVDERVWEWEGLRDDEQGVWAAYLEHVDSNGSWETARDAFQGTANSEADWAEQWLEDTGSLQDCPAHLRNYIDFEAYARDAQLGGDVRFVRHDGELYVFSNH